MSEEFDSNHKVGGVAYFQPVLSKFDGSGIADDTAIPCLVVAVKFTGGKVLYDLALPNGEGYFYEAHPLCNVDSYFVLKAPQEC